MGYSLIRSIGVLFRHRHAPLVLAISLGVTLSMTLFFLVRDWEHAIIDADFEFNANLHTAALHAETDRHNEIVKSIAHFYDASEHITRDEFKLFVDETIEKHKGTLGIAWVPRVRAPQRIFYEKSAREDGLDSFMFLEKTAEGRLGKVAYREEYFPIYYIEPTAPNQHIIGLDLGASRKLSRILAEIEESGEITSSNITGYLPDIKGNVMVTVLPVYEKSSILNTAEQRRVHLRGYVMAFRYIDQFIEESLVNNPVIGVDFSVYEINDKGQRKLLSTHSSRTRKASEPFTAVSDPGLVDGIYSRVAMEMQGDSWELLYTPAPQFIAIHPIWRSWSVLLIGLLLTALLSIYIITAIRKTREIMELASSLSTKNIEMKKEIVGRTKIESALRSERNRAQKYLDVAETIMVAVNPDQEIVLINKKGCQVLGYEEDELIGRNWFEACFPRHLQEISKKTFDAIIDKQAVPAEYSENEIQTKTGERRIIAWHNTVLKNNENEITATLSSGEDVTERRWAEAEMKTLSGALEQTADSVMITDSDGIIEYVNPAFETMTGFSRSEAVGNKGNIMKSGRHDNDFYQKLWTTILSGNVFMDIIVNRKKDGELYYEEKTITPLKDTEGNVIKFVSTGKDISERMQTQERLHYLAYYDVLTELPNRILFMERLGHALTKRRVSGHRLAILFLDLDRFKNINDTLGHDIGDRLLQVLSERLTRVMRSEDTVARLGGDEFAVLLEDIRATEDASNIAQVIHETLSETFVIDGNELFVTTSIGISLSPDDGEDSNVLLKNADTAMYRAKEQGRNTHQFYSAEMGAKVLERLTLETSLHRAIDENEFLLYYQPQLDIISGKIIGLEALIRWQHPSIGLIYPLNFISLLEDTGLIVQVGEWVVKTAAAQLKVWRSLGLKDLRVAVNLSCRQFQEPSLAEVVHQIVKDAGIEPEQIELEMTESVLMQSSHAAMNNFSSFKKMGFKLSIDDFGTGYSSLSYLKRFPVDVLKIDRSFIHDLSVDSGNKTIVSAIIAMAHSLGMKVVAEGVEDNAQLEFLHSVSCDIMQGDLFSSALPVEQMSDMLKVNAQTDEPASLTRRPLRP